MLIENQSSRGLEMEKSTKLEVILIVIPIACSITLGFLLYTEEELLTEFLSQAIYFLIAGIVTPLGIIFWKKIQKHNIDSEPNKKPANLQSNSINHNQHLEDHSKNDIVKALEIMSEGHYGEYLEKNQFLIPYPFSEYKHDKRRMDFPTTTEINEWLNKPTEVEPKKYDFVPFSHSPEAKFEWAMAHLESYDDIKKKFENAEKANQRLEDFSKKNKQQLDEHYKNLLAMKEVNQLFSDKFLKIVEEYNKASTELRGSIQILYYKLKRGEIIKGKCDVCS